MFLKVNDYVWGAVGDIIHNYLKRTTETPSKMTLVVEGPNMML